MFFTSWALLCLLSHTRTHMKSREQACDPIHSPENGFTQLHWSTGDLQVAVKGKDSKVNMDVNNSWRKMNIIFITMFSLVYKHLKLRIVVFSFAEWTLHIHIGSGSSTTELPYCTAIFLQKPRTDKPNTGSREGLWRFYVEVAATIGSPTRLEREGWGKGYQPHC